MRSRFAGHARPYNLVSFALSILSILPLLLTEVICLENVQRSSLKSWAYEWGLFGGYPQASFKSSTLRPPRMNVVKWSEECESGYTLLSLRGVAVPKPAAVIVDGRGELVWMDESFGYAMNLKVQTYKHKQYLTFWSGSFGEGFGKGTYYMVCNPLLLKA